MAMPATHVYEFRSSATANMVNGGGFNSARGGVDYTLQDAAQVHSTDGASTASTNFTSVTGGFTDAMKGNTLHLVSATGTPTVGWYEIVSVTDANTLVLDRVSGTHTLADFYIGGALTMSGSLNDAFWEQLIAGNYVWIKAGTHTLGSAVTVTTAVGTSTLPINVEGYASTRGDAPTPFGTSPTAPLIACAASAFTLPSFTIIKYLNVTSTAASGLATATAGTHCAIYKCKSINSSTTAARNGITTNTGTAAFSRVLFCEAVSQNGSALSFLTGRSCLAYGCYLHDSNVGLLCSATGGCIILEFNVIESNKSGAVQITGATPVLGMYFTNNTFYGSEAKVGIGIDMSAVAYGATFMNNIIYGFVTGINQTTAQEKINIGFYNDFNNNTTDATNYTVDDTSVATAPSFVGVTQLTGSTATTAASVLTQSGGDFSTVEDNVDFLRVTSGTGVTTGIYLITSHTSTTLTVNNALGTSSGGDVVWTVPTGHNLAITGNI